MRNKNRRNSADMLFKTTALDINAERSEKAHIEFSRNARSRGPKKWTSMALPKLDKNQKLKT
jgi:hypothetical protein